MSLLKLIKYQEDIGFLIQVMRMEKRKKFMGLDDLLLIEGIT